MTLAVPRPRLARLSFDARWIALGVPVLLVAYLTLVPVGMLVVGAFKTGDPGVPGEFTLAHVAEAFGDASLYPLILNSTLYSLGAAGLAFLLGGTLAWIVERTNTPLKSLFYALTLVPFIIPGVLHAIAWIYLLSPRIGLINLVLMGVFGLSDPPFDVFTVGGMIWVEGLHITPLVFVLMTAAFRGMDPALEEAALTSGANTLSTLRRITLQLMLPAVASVFLLMFIRGLESFEVPALIGLPAQIRVFTSRIYLALHDYPANFGLASAYSLLLIAVTIVGIYLYNRVLSRSEQFVTVTGKAYRPRQIDLGKWRFAALGVFVAYFLLVVGLPFFILLWGSLVPFFTPPAWDMVDRLTLSNYADLNILGCGANATFCLRARAAFTNSLLLGVGAATIVMLLTSVIAWISTRTTWRARALLDLMAFVPITIPGLVLAVSLMWVYLTLPIGIYGTLGILLVAYVTRFMPYGIRTVSISFVQIHRELEEAAHISGGSWWQTFRRVTLPLLKPGLIAGWVYVLVVSMRELSTSVLLASSQNQVLATLIFDLKDGGNIPHLAALGVMLILTLVVLVLVANKLGARFGVQEH